MANYRVVMLDGETIEVESEGMNQVYGFLVFSDEDDEGVFGLRSDQVRSWERVSKPVRAAIKISSSRKGDA